MKENKKVEDIAKGQAKKDPKFIISVIILGIAIVIVYSCAYVASLQKKQKALEENIKSSAEDYVINMTVDLYLKQTLDNSTNMTFDTKEVNKVFAEDGTAPDAVDLKVVDGTVTEGTITYSNYIVTITNNSATGIKQK